MFSTPGLDTGFFISAKDEFVISQRHALPLAMIQVQDSCRLQFKLRVPREYPTTILPWFNDVFIEPSPYCRATNLGNDASTNGLRCNFVTAESRQWNATIKWQFTRQRLNLDNYLRGKKRTDARALVYPRVLRSAPQKISFSTCSRFGAANSDVSRWFHYLDLERPSKRSLLERPHNTVTYNYWRYAQVHSVRSPKERCDKDFLLASISPGYEGKCMPQYTTLYRQNQYKIRHRIYEPMYLALGLASALVLIQRHLLQQHLKARLSV